MKALFGVSLAAALAGACLTANAAPITSAATSVRGFYMQHGGWEAPPEELDEVARHGYHDGVEGARKDYGNHRRPDVNNRDEFRHPPVPGRDREAYRRGFERGYHAGVEHLYHDHM